MAESFQRKRSLPQVVGKALSEVRRGGFILRHGGAAAGWRFLREEVVRNTLLRVRRPPAGAELGVECNVCGWRGWRFLTHCGGGYVNYDCFCPRCRSYPRHRGFSYLLDHHLAERIREPGSGGGLRLLFAPEPGMRMLLGRHVSGLVGVDRSPINELVEHLEDIQDLSFADGSVDFFSCFHVVEHVPDDRAALRELARVLHPGGVGIFNVPISFGRRETIAFGAPNPLAFNHWFDYGEDFPERLVEAGFSGTGYRFTRVLPDELAQRLFLQDEMIFCLARTPEGQEARILDHEDDVLARARGNGRTR